MIYYDEIFLSIQGESSDSGLPCIFVRLYGCPVGCSYCDQPQTPEQRKRISEALKGKTSHQKGKPISEETKAKISNTLKKWNAEHESPNKGRKYKKTKEAILATSRGHYKPVVCIETGIIYESIMAAETLTKTDGSSISAVCKGKRKTAGGYHWRYQKDV